MTGCGCLLLVATLAVMLYVLLFGSTDAGEPIEQAIALAALLIYARARTRAGPKATHEGERRGYERIDHAATAGRRSLQLVTRS